MHYKVLKNGNVEIGGKQYIPQARLEKTIEEALVFKRRKDIMRIVILIVAIVISFACGYAIG